MAYTVTNNPWTSQHSVGIGTESVSANLTIVGTDSLLQISDSSNYGGFYMTHSGTSSANTTYLKCAGINSDLMFNVNNAGTEQDVMKIDKSGNVGIGTTAPSRLLTVSSTTGQADLTIRSADDSWSQLMFGDQSADNVAGVLYDNSSSKLHLNTSTTGSEGIRLTIDNSGNIGIGTTSPAQTLHVAGGNLSTIRNNMLGMTSNSVGAGAETNIYHNAYYDTSDNREEYLVGDEACRLQFINGTTNFFQAVAGSTDGAITWIPSIAIEAGGNVGIGTSGLADGSERMLKIYGHGNSGDSTLGIVRFFNDSTAIAQIDVSRQDDDTSGQFAIRTNDSNGGLSERFTIRPDGNVGIGDDTPSYKLEVAGTFYASGSSQAFKKDVTDLAVDSSTIYNLNPKSYNYKKDYENFGYDLAEGKQFGLISEEVAESVPELAIMKDGEPKNVDYQKLSVLLLAEMQKMNKRIEDLECHI